MADVFAYLEGFGVSGGSPNKSTIIVTAPTGSTVTCKMGPTTKTATEKNGVWKFGGLDLGTWTITSTKGGDSATQDVAITRLTIEYVTIVYRITPEFTYTGNYAIVDDSGKNISDFASWKNNWRIRFLTSGIFTVTKLNGWNGQLDVFLVGGGGGGVSSSGPYGSSGGGGGYTSVVKNHTVSVNTAYNISIGAGGSASNKGGATKAFGITANGGTTGNGNTGGAGGSGGGGMGANSGGSNGANGGSGGAWNTTGGAGQQTTTREFGESSGTLYSGGGGGGGNVAYPGYGTGGAGGGANAGKSAKANTGGGGGGHREDVKLTAGSGGSGICIIRNKR